MRTTLLLGVLGGPLLWLSACSSAPPAQVPTVFGAPAASPASASAPAGKAPIDALLTQPLDQDAAVRLALAHSPALAALQAHSEALAAQARAEARPGLFGLSLARLRQGDETTIERHLSLGLLDLLLWPWRSDATDRRIDVQQQAQAMAVLNHAHAVRAQWVKAVAAQARARYQADSLDTALLAADLAQRLQTSGQFSAAQQQSHAIAASEARLAQAVATQHARREREALLRLLGLQGEQARQLRLPEALPPVPQRPNWTEAQVRDAARASRMDLRLAESRWLLSRGQSRHDIARSLVDVDLGWQRNTSNGAPAQQGPSLDFRLISIDLGAARRDAVRLEERAALADWQQVAVDAESQLRERWADLQAAQALATEASQVLGTLRTQLLAERLKQYNGMLIGPLELLDEARAKAGSVTTALDALRDHWLADAALQAAIDGVDAPSASLSAPAADAPTSASH
jgi:outer membrane protein TolC